MDVRLYVAWLAHQTDIRALNGRINNAQCGTTRSGYHSRGEFGRVFDRVKQALQTAIGCVDSVITESTGCNLAEYSFFNGVTRGVILWIAIPDMSRHFSRVHKEGLSLGRQTQPRAV